MKEHCIVDISRYRAVLFDMDGVITDTMPLHLKSWQEAFRPYNVQVEKMEIYRLEGMPTKMIARAVAEENKKQFSFETIEQIVQEKNRVFDGEASKRSMAFDGVPETLTTLRGNGIRTGLVTGSRLQTAKNLLRQAHLEGLFDVVVTGDDTSKGKPDPEPFLLAMKMLGVAKLNCVVVENAPLGVRAARAAGIGYIVAVTTSLDESFLKEADDIMASVPELTQCLARRFAAIPGRTGR